MNNGNTVFRQVVPEAVGLAGDAVGVVELLVEPRFLGDSWIIDLNMTGKITYQLNVLSPLYQVIVY